MIPQIIRLLSGPLLAVILTACTEPADTARRAAPPPPVVTEPVRLRSERVRVEAVGTSRALKSIEVHPAASGEVIRVHFRPGEFVESGELLVELDQRNETLAVQLAEVRMAEAKRLFERYQTSAAKGATNPTTLDAARSELDAARIELDRAQIALDDRTITAPFAGHVGFTDVDAGDRIQPATVVTTLDDRSSLAVSFAVPELLIGDLAVGDEVTIRTWAASGQSVTGKLIEIDSRINPETRTFLARASVNNVNDALRPGMSFRVHLDIMGAAYPVLSEIAVQWGSDGSYVWSVVDGIAQRVAVNIVQRQQGEVLVNGGLVEGDLIVVEGIQRLRPGVTVKPVAGAGR